MFATLEAKVLLSITLVVILVSGFGVYTYHERALGKAAELTALKASSDKLQADTAKQTAELKARATMAEQAYDKERLSIANQPPSPAVRLCLDANSRPFVPSRASKVARNALESTSTAGVQPVPAGDSSSGQGRAGPDISKLLSALAARADQVSATLREFQNNE